MSSLPQHREKHRHRRHKQRSSSWDPPQPTAVPSGKQKRNTSAHSKIPIPWRHRDRSASVSSTSSSKLGEIPPEKLEDLRAAHVPGPVDVRERDRGRSRRRDRERVPGSWRSSFSESESENERRGLGRYRREEDRIESRIRRVREGGKGVEVEVGERRGKIRSRSESFGLGSLLRLRPSPEKGGQRDFVYRLEGTQRQREDKGRKDRDWRARGRQDRYRYLKEGECDIGKGGDRGREIERVRHTTQEIRTRVRRRERDTDVRPSESVSNQFDTSPPQLPPTHQPPTIVQPGYRRATMRTVSSDDYLLARGANPRTGVVSPSVWTPSRSSRGTPSPEHKPVYPDLSPSPGGGRNPFERLRKRHERESSGQKWRLRGEEWISLGMDEATPGTSPIPPPPPPSEAKERRHTQRERERGIQRDYHANDEKSATVPSPYHRAEVQQPTIATSTSSPTRRQRTVPLRELQDKFVVNMPSAREPSPPQMSPSMIEEYQMGLQRIAGEGAVMVDTAVLPKALDGEPTIKFGRARNEQPTRTPPRVTKEQWTRVSPRVANEEQRMPTGVEGNKVERVMLTPITEKSTSGFSKGAVAGVGMIQRKAIGSPISAKSPTQNVMRAGGYEAEQNQERASSAPTPRKARNEKRIPTWNSPDDVHGGEQRQVHETRERGRSQSQSPFLGRGARGEADTNANCLNSTGQGQGRPLFETTMNAFRYLSPLYSKMTMPMPMEAKENQGEGAERDGVRDRRCSHSRLQVQHQNFRMEEGCTCCQSRAEIGHGETFEKPELPLPLPLPYPSSPPKNQQFSNPKTDEKGRKNAHITTTPTSIPTTTTSPQLIIQSRGPCHIEPPTGNGTVVRRPRPKPQRTDGAVNVPQVSLSKMPLSPGGGRPWFMPPKVDLLGGWDPVGTGKAVKMRVEGKEGRVPRVLVPGESPVGKYRCRCQGKEMVSTTSGQACGDGGREGVMKRNGRGFIRIDGLDGDGADEGVCCDCESGNCSIGVGNGGLRARAMENEMGRMRRARVLQNKGEVAELESPLGSFEDESVSGDGTAEWNESDETLVPRPLKPNRRREEEDPESIDETRVDSAEKDLGPSELDLRLSSLLVLIHHAGTLLVKYNAFDRSRVVLRRLANMAVHIFQTAVRLHDVLLLPRYYHPRSKIRRRSGNRNKEKERLEIVKLTRDCAVAGGELLVLVGVAVLVGRIGVTVMGCVNWMRWVGGWLGWLLKGLFWG